MKKNNKSNVSQLSHALSSVDMQRLLMSRAKNAVLATAIELMEQDMEELCGAKFSHKSNDDLCHRGGSEQTSLLIDGAKLPILRPRARKNGGEVRIQSLEKMRDVDLLDRQMLSRLMRGVSTRNYSEVINGFSDKTGVSKSSVSRAFKRGSKKDLDKLNSADLSQDKFVAILIDGSGFGDQTLVVAVGITDDNRKVPLGLISGNTENAGVVKDLLTSITSRGFVFSCKRILAVLDGGKALRCAVKALWGDAVVIQRCWIHKLRNIKDYIPNTNHGQLWRRMKKMMGLKNQSQAQKEFEALTNWLSTLNDDAVKSLNEAKGELLTVHSLDISGEYRSSLSNTNLIESLIGVVKGKTKNVKNWDYHPNTKSKVARDKALRWAATAIETHRPKMHRLKGGKKQIDTLINNLNIVDKEIIVA